MVAQMAAGEVVGVLADAIAGKPAPTGVCIDANPLKYKAWPLASKKKQNNPQATGIHDDNYYEGSLGHTRRLPGPEAAVFIQ